MNTSLERTHDLFGSERRFLAAMQQVGFGRFEFLRILNGELVLEPWPTTIRDLKLGARSNAERTSADDFALKQQVIELFQYTRSVDDGEIRILEVRHGLPFSMEIELSGKAFPANRRTVCSA